MARCVTEAVIGFLFGCRYPLQDRQVTPATATLCFCLLATAARAVAPTADEQAEARRWAAAKFAGRQQTEPVKAGLIGSTNLEAPLSFVYDGKPSAELLQNWELKRSSRKIGDEQSRGDTRRHEKTEHTLE